jgi:hypothetical protein
MRLGSCPAVRAKPLFIDRGTCRPSPHCLLGRHLSEGAGLRGARLPSSTNGGAALARSTVTAVPSCWAAFFSLIERGLRRPPGP